MRKNNSAMRDICGAYAGSVRKYMRYAELMHTPSKVADIFEWACAPHVCMKVYKCLHACMHACMHAYSPRLCLCSVVLQLRMLVHPCRGNDGLLRIH